MMPFAKRRKPVSLQEILGGRLGDTSKWYPSVNRGLQPPELSDIEKILAEADSPEDLKAAMDALITSGVVTKEQAADYFDKYIEPVSAKYLDNFTSKADLADRIARLGLPVAKAKQLYSDKTIDLDEDELALRAARGRYEAAQTRKRQKAELAQQKEEARQFEESAKTRMLQWQIDQAEPEFQKQAQRSSPFDAQRNRALLAGVERSGAEAREPLLRRTAFEAPEEEELNARAAELGLGGYHETSRLRNFIESQMAGVAEETRPAREKWLERMRAPRERPTYQSELSRITGEGEQWQNVAENASDADISGGTYYGVGGLKAIAEQAFRDTQESLAGLRPESFGVRTPFKPEEDPLKAALRKRNFEAEYYRRPGTGISPRLQRAVRYR